MPTIVFLDQGKRGSVAAGCTVLEAALELGVAISHVCNGEGTCSTCRVACVVNPGNLSPTEPNEIAYEMGPGVRLGCQARIEGDVGVRVVPIPKVLL
jgi:adenylate cyclase